MEITRDGVRRLVQAGAQLVEVLPRDEFSRSRQVPAGDRLLLGRPLRHEPTSRVPAHATRVFGLSRAQAGGWHAPAAWLSLTGAAALLAAFAGWQARAAAPLLPLRVLADRDRPVP